MSGDPGFDTGSAVYTGTINSDDFVRTDDGSGYSLTTFLTAAGGLDGGDQWEFVFTDDAPGQPQGRFASVSITSDEGSVETRVLMPGTDGVDDLIYGAETDDILGGMSGDDTIFDGAGEDTITAGDGADMINLTADNDSDLIDYDNISEIGDSVTGFNTGAPASGGDQINLADLITFAGTTDVADGVNNDGTISFADSGSGGTNVLIDPDGPGVGPGPGGVQFEIVLTLEGIGFTSVGDSVTLLSDNIIVV